jgi:hypothetical protein
MMRLSGTKSPCGAKSFLHRQISLYWLNAFEEEFFSLFSTSHGNNQ